jgi:hypothetical protein
MPARVWDPSTWGGWMLKPVRSTLVDMTRSESPATQVSTIALFLAIALALLIAPSAHARLKFGPPQNLSPVGETASTPSLGIDSQDRMTVAWWRLAGQERIESVRVGADGVAGELRTLFSNPSVRLFGPRVAVAPGGGAFAVWMRDVDFFESDDDCAAGPQATCVQAIHLDANGQPGPVRTLSSFDTPERDPDLVGQSDPPRVAVDSQGRATVVWRRTDAPTSDQGFDSVVEAVRLDAAGAPGPVQTLSGEGAGDPSLTIDSHDRATVVWPRFDGKNTRIETVRLDADGTPGEVRSLFKRGENDDPRVAVDDRGRATVVWHQTLKPRRIRSVRLRADGSPGAVKTLAKRSQSPELGVDARGRPTVVWQRTTKTRNGTLQFRVQSVRLDASGAPGPIKKLSKSRAFDAQIAVDRRGRATVAWGRLRLRDKKGIERIEARRLSPRGKPERVQTITKAVGVGSPQVAVDSQGRPTMAWVVSDLSVGGLIQSARGRG